MTGPQFRRLDLPGDTSLPPGLDESRLLPVLAHMAADLLAARARGDDPADRAPTLADLIAAGLTPADCLALISDGFLTAVDQPSARKVAGTVPVPSPHKVAGTVQVPSAHRANKGASLGRAASSSKNERDAAKSPSPIGKRQRTGKSHSPAGKGRGEGKAPSPAGRGRGQGGTDGPPPHLGPRILLTDAGLASITKHAQTAGSIAPSPSGKVPDEGELPRAISFMPSLSRLLPHYDMETRELSVAGTVILCLRLQARNLTAVLSALELSGWKARVKRPLNGSPGGNDHHHLANAALSLNHHQNLIEFSTDDGAICWAWGHVPVLAP